MPHSCRDKKPDLKLLEKEPQKNLESVHSILASSIRDLDTRLRGLQRSFYGLEKDATDELITWSTTLRRVVNEGRVEGLFSVGQMEDLSRAAAIDGGVASVDPLAVRQMMECCRKTEDVLPPAGKMEPILVEIKRILVLVDRYCASFYNPESDAFVEAASAYEKQRRRYINVADDFIEKIYELAGKFRSSSDGEGVRLVDLSAHSAELSRRTDSAHAPFLLLFPEACENIRSVLTLVRTWIENDRNYAGFLDADVRTLERRRTEAELRVRLLRQAYHRLGFRRKQAAASADRLGRELERGLDRQHALVFDEDATSIQVDEIQTELDSTEFRKSEWMRTGTIDGKKSGPEFYERLNEFTDRIRTLKAELPSAQQRLAAVRAKLKKVEGKRSELRAEEKRRFRLEAEIDDVSARLAESELELSGTAHALELARKIIVCKRSSDVVEKIFYDQQVVKTDKSKRQGGQDVFDKACFVVATGIGRDWPALYRVLPFHPPRGLATVDQDIFDLLDREARGGKEHMARLALDRWRRNHTKAKIEDLEVALGLVHRADIAHRMYAQVRPKKPEVTVETEIPDWVDAALVPYWREIERYDAAAAAAAAVGKNRSKNRQIVAPHERMIE